MAEAARLAELITEDFYGRHLDFSARKPGSDDWSNLPEVEATDRMPPTDAAVATDALRDDRASGRTVRLVPDLRRGGRQDAGCDATMARGG